MSFIGGQNVGIGKTNPSYNLDVSGSINFSGGLLQNGNNVIGITPQTYFSTSSSGTFSVPSNCKWIRIRMVGGGGGGQGGSSSSQGSVGSAGGNTTITVNGSVVTAGGGGGGFPGARNGGVPSNVPSNSIGMYGSNGESVQTAASFNSGGNGGNSFFGGCGVGGLNNGTNASSAYVNSGSGGGGGASGNTGGYYPGGGGGAGAYIEFTITNPSTSYNYTTGSGGSGGAQGGGLGNGGNGANGFIYFECYF